MRPIKQLGFAPMSEINREVMLNEHIPYRLSLLRDGFLPWVPPCQHTNQAFEAGVLSGRILLSFLGIGCDRKTGTLKEDHSHDAIDKKTDDVKAPDVGAAFVDLGNLSSVEKNILATFIRGAHKACAHFTIESDHKLDLPAYKQAAPIIFRLMHDQFRKNAQAWPKWTN